jgi:hypothetical protein
MTDSTDHNPPQSVYPYTAGRFVPMRLNRRPMLVHVHLRVAGKPMMTNTCRQPVRQRPRSRRGPVITGRSTMALILMPGEVHVGLV